MLMMENNISTENRFLNKENIYQTIKNIEKKYEKAEPDEFTFGLQVEDGKNFFRYLKNFNLSKDPDLLILPPNNHYFFDEHELNHVRTLINLKNLNLIKDLDSFLYNLGRMLPSEANFLGFFSYNKLSLSVDSLISGLYTRFNNFLDLKKDHNLSEKELDQRLSKYGFRIVDMTEMNGLTYFYARKSSYSSKAMA
jgi:hypothetical protein